MKLIDLCSGIGGFSLAARWMGWQTTAFCEIDTFCQKVLVKNFPGVPIFDDLFTFPAESFRGRIDVLTAGFPCQPFSAAGKRKGRDDERHLFPQILEIVARVQPSWCVFENVRGLLSIESGRLFSEIISSVEGLGFEVVTFCIPASAVNALHRRDRIWIIAHTDSFGERTGHREIQGPNGEIPKRHDNAELGNTEICVATAPNAGREYGTRGSLLRKHEGQDRQGDAFEPERSVECNGEGAVAQSGGVGCDNRSNHRQERYLPTDEGLTSESEPEREGWERWASSVGSDASDSTGEGLERPFGTQQSGYRRRPAASHRRQSESWDENWLEAATRLCTLDDGLPRGLVRPKGWRVNALQAAGNAIVPQIAFEIFKAIEQAEK